MAEHADTFAYRDRLAAQVGTRAWELGQRAIAEQPAHLTALLGPVPDDPAARGRWRTHATRIETYREEWCVPGDRLDQAPTDRVQHQAWANAVGPAQQARRHAEHALQRVERSTQRQVERDIDLGIDLGW